MKKYFHTKNLRKIVRIFWPQIISNQDLFGECQQESIETTIARRRWRWIGHILRKDQEQQSNGNQRDTENAGVQG